MRLLGLITDFVRVWIKVKLCVRMLCFYKIALFRIVLSPNLSRNENTIEMCHLGNTCLSSFPNNKMDKLERFLHWKVSSGTFVVVTLINVIR